MSKTNERSGLKKCDQVGAKNSKLVSTRALLFDTWEYNDLNDFIHSYESKTTKVTIFDFENEKEPC